MFSSNRFKKFRTYFLQQGTYYSLNGVQKIYSFYTYLKFNENVSMKGVEKESTHVYGILIISIFQWFLNYLIKRNIYFYFSGLVLQDLTFVHIGNSNLLPDGNINFSKRWQQFNIVENMKKFKKS